MRTLLILAMIYGTMCAIFTTWVFFTYNFSNAISAALLVFGVITVVISAVELIRDGKF